MYKMMKFYKNLSGGDRVRFLRDLFYLGRYNPGFYWVAWVVVGLFCFLLNLRLFIYFVCLMFFWYFIYLVVVLMFVYKWKKKHLNSNKF